MLGMKVALLTEPAATEHSAFAEAEAHPDATYAIVIMSPEIAGPLHQEEIGTNSNPGQNAILQLGYFAGKLGHQRVCALYRPGMEIPASRSGIQQIEMDDYGGWRLNLARLLRAAGFQIDMNQAL
jgi:predicted nucleotide-binding protein